MRAGRSFDGTGQGWLERDLRLDSALDHKYLQYVRLSKEGTRHFAAQCKRPALWRGGPLWFPCFQLVFACFSNVSTRPNLARTGVKSEAMPANRVCQIYNRRPALNMASATGRSKARFQTDQLPTDGVGTYVAGSTFSHLEGANQWEPRKASSGSTIDGWNQGLNCPPRW